MTNPIVIDPTRTDARTPNASTPGEFRQALAFARAETIVLFRNRTAFFTALLMPLLMVGIFASLPTGLAGAPAVLGMIVGSALLFVVYYTLVTAAVARREEYSLKRLYTSSARPITVLIAMGLPLLVLLLAQTLVGLAAVAVLFEVDGFGRPWLLGIAVLLGAGVWWALGLASATLTRSVEAAQLTTLPLILVALGLSGLSAPIALLPNALQIAAQLSPMFPVIDLIALSMTPLRATGETVVGGQWWLAVVLDVGVLLAWLAIGSFAIRRSFRWEPRR